MPNMIVTIIIFVVIGIIISMLFRFLRKTFKWFIFVWIAVVVIALGFGYFLIVDINDLRENLPTESKLILLELDGEFVTGFYLEDINELFGQQADMFEITQGLKVPNLAELNSKYETSYKGIDEEAYKVFILKEPMFDAVGEVNFGEINLTKEDMLEALKSDSPKDILLNQVAGTESQREQLSAQLGTDESFKNTILLGLFSQAQTEEGSSYIIAQLKGENIQVYKETITFKVIKLLPSFLVGNALPVNGGAS